MKVLVFLCAIGLAVGGHLGTVTTQYHAQDELGQYSYGYAGGPSAKHESRTLDGITRGGYSYLDGHGLVQSAAYVSDAHNGFRVAATNLPVGPAVPAGPVATAVAAAPYVAAAAPVVAAAPAYAAAPAVAALAAGAVAAPLVAPAASIVAAHAYAPSVVTGHSVVSQAPGISTTRVVTPTFDTVTVNSHPINVWGVHGLNGLHGLHGLLRHRRSLGLAGLGLAYGNLGIAPLGVVGHGYVGHASHSPVDTLAVPGFDTNAVITHRAAHNVAHAATSARDISNHGVAFAHGLAAPLAYGGILGVHGVHGLLRHRRSLVSPWAVGHLGHLGHLGHVPLAAVSHGYVGPASHAPVDTLAVPGFDTNAVIAHRAAHNVAHAATSARDISNHGVALAHGLAAPLAHGGIWGVHGIHGLLRHRRSLVSPLALGHVGHLGHLGHVPLAAVSHGYIGAASHAPVDTLAVPGFDTNAVIAHRAAHNVAHAATSARDVTNYGVAVAAGVGAPVLSGHYVGPLSHGLGSTLAAPGHLTPAVAAATAAHNLAHVTANAGLAHGHGHIWG